MLKAIIIDDRRLNTETLQELVLKFCPSVTIVATAPDIEQGYLLINKFRPDIVFLDIELDNRLGFDLLKMFRNVFFKIIFTTGHEQYAIDAFRAAAVDYLLKPIDITHLIEAVSKAEEQIKQANHNIASVHVFPETKISLPTQDGYIFINYNDIIRCEGSGSYTYFYFIDGKKMVTSLRLKECEAILPQNIFCRVHHSHIVNVNYVKKYIKGKGGQIVLNNEINIEVSAARKEAFLELIRKP